MEHNQSSGVTTSEGMSRRRFLAGSGSAIAAAGLMGTLGAVVGPTAAYAASGEATAGLTGSTTRPNIVLVHGAWSDGSAWRQVISSLSSGGYPVTAVQLSLYSLNDDARTAGDSDVTRVRHMLATLTGPTVLVGHSYGGSVITEAAAGNPNVVSLVYCAGFAPDVGESIGDLLGKYPPAPGIQYVGPDPFGWLFIDRGHFQFAFCADVSADTATVLSVVQQPLFSGVFPESPNAAAWHDLPVFYQVSTNDNMINPDLQRWMANRMSATVVELASSHAAPVSRPNDIAKLIRQAAAV